MQAQERLWLTADRKRLVRDGDPDAATLYAAHGDEIPDSAATMFGLVDGAIKEKTPGGNKEKTPGGDKERKPDSDKGSTDAPRPATGGGGDAAAPARQAPQAQDDLTRISGIGPATASKLAEAGITSFAALADTIAVEGIGSEDDWRSWTAQAAELAAEVGGPEAPAEPAAKGGLTINRLNKSA